ncbi:MAG: flavodoxin FldA [Tannerellaceae bacterium]|jgi:flavodoxin I|nr:flavodoxin FldA [Tannerellaceae bacterium]
MKKTGIFYGSSSGTTEDLAQRIATLLGVGSADMYNVSDVPASAVAPYEVIILGTSTWGSGDLQDDWDSFLPKLKKVDLSGKTIALFGAGDSSSFGDTFCDGIGIIYKQLKATGATFAGATPVDGYTFYSSEAVVDGAFVGLPLDEANESHLTDSRLARWIAQLKAEGLCD